MPMEKLTAAAFGQRRKMLRGALAGLFSDPTAVLTGLGPHQNGLQHPLVADRRGQLLQIGGIEDLARLIGIGLQALDRCHAHAGQPVK